MDALVRRFWWNSKSKNGQYFTPVAWSSLCWPQKGKWAWIFWDFNQALLSKLAWWALSQKDCPCINLLCAKYMVRQNWLNQPTPIGPSRGPSPIWKSMEGTKALIAQGAYLLARNGISIRVWEDPWVPDHLGLKPIPKEGANEDIVCNGNYKITIYTSGCNDKLDLDNEKFRYNFYQICLLAKQRLFPSYQ